MVNMELQEQIKSLGIRRAALSAEINVVEGKLSVIAAEAKAISKEVEQKRERLNHLDYAINNLRSVIELEAPVVEEQPAVDPWGES
jgi:chromosome segregation ATPase